MGSEGGLQLGGLKADIIQPRPPRVGICPCSNDQSMTMSQRVILSGAWGSQQHHQNTQGCAQHTSVRQKANHHFTLLSTDSSSPADSSPPLICVAVPSA